MTHQIVTARLEHVRAIVRTMRPMDRAEIEGMGLCVRHTLHHLWRNSSLRKAALVEGEVAAVWGLEGPMLDDVGMPWAFTAPAVERARLAFYRETRAEIEAMLHVKRRLQTYVLADYARAIRFFGRFGFQFCEPAPLVAGGPTFRRMILERPDGS